MPTGAPVQMKQSAILPRRVPAPISDQASAHLNMLRGIAAFIVLFGHWRNIFFVDWPQVRQRNLFLEFFYGSTKYGHEAVVVFFVLSGYLIGRSVLRAVWAGRWSAKHYAFHRLVRLELVLLPALLLCWLWDSAGIHLFSPSPTYLGTGGSSVLLGNIPHWLNFHIFLGNLAFLQTLLVPCFGSDQSLWSLANEFWYYALFPCLVIALTKSFSRVSRSISTLAFVSIVFFIGKWMFFGFLVWLLGVVLIFLPPPVRLKHRYYLLALALSFAFIIVQLILTFDPLQIEKGLNTDFILGILVAIFMYLLLHYPDSVRKWYTRIADQAAGFSYTLYLTHLPVLVFFSAMLNHRSLPAPGNFPIPIAILCLTVAYSYGIAWIFERNTDRIRKKLEARFRL